MEGRVKVLLLFGLMLVVFAGCIGGPSTPSVTEGGSTPLNVSGGAQQPPAQQPLVGCVPSYTFSELPETGTLGQPVQFSVVSTCAKDRVIGLNIDGKQEAGGKLATNDPVTFNFVLLPSVEGMKDLVVWSDNDVVYNRTWEVLPIGSTDVSGNKNDPASVKEWVATSFETGSAITVKSVGAYMKRLYYETMESSMVVAEIRADNNGAPASSYLALSELPITETTLTENWIYFNYPEGVQLPAGKYWVVFRVTQETRDQIVSDVVNVHYTFGGDTTVPGNDYTRQMDLEWNNNERRFAETSWQPLAYERTYAVIVSGKEH